MLMYQTSTNLRQLRPQFSETNSFKDTKQTYRRVAPDRGRDLSESNQIHQSETIRQLLSHYFEQ